MYRMITFEVIALIAAILIIMGIVFASGLLFGYIKQLGEKRNNEQK